MHMSTNPVTYFNGCPCHIVQNAVQKVGIFLQMFVGLMLKSFPLIYTIGSTNPLIGRMNSRYITHFVTRISYSHQTHINTMSEL